MLNIQKRITKVNYTPLANKRNMWIVIHYVGAVSTAKANALYFEKVNRKASANYFVDENEIWQVVEDKDGAWHVGGATKYYNSARNNNSIGIEMCCKRNGTRWYIEPKTIQNTIELVRYLARKYSVPIDRICRHYDVTAKICPEPLVRDEQAWQDFLRRVEVVTMDEKIEKIQEYYGFGNKTITYFELYKWGDDLLNKLYDKAENGTQD